MLEVAEEPFLERDLGSQDGLALGLGQPTRLLELRCGHGVCSRVHYVIKGGMLEDEAGRCR